MRRCVLWLLPGLLLSACHHGGSVYVSHPQVFSRERLIKERFEEQQWLASKLDDFDPALSGYQDVRSFEGFYGSLNRPTSCQYKQK